MDGNRLYEAGLDGHGTHTTGHNQDKQRDLKGSGPPKSSHLYGNNGGTSGRYETKTAMDMIRPHEYRQWKDR